MYTTAPEITNDITVGQVIVAATPSVTPTSTSVSTTSSTSSTPSPKPTSVVEETPPLKQYMIKPFSIYGYTGPNTPIYLVGFGVSERTVSDNSGFFRFTKIYSYSLFYPELCVYAVDSENRVTQPVCIPGLVEDRTIPSEVGPILLPPSISISKNNIKIGDESIVLGLTVPNSEVDVRLIRVGEYPLPLYQIKSRQDGTFEFSLPSSSLATYRISLSTRVGDFASERSNTLNFSVIGYVATFLERLKTLFLNNKLGLLVIFELIVIMLLGVLVLKSPTQSKKNRKKLSELQQKYISLIKPKTKEQKEIN